jgi:hypothetical protein
MELRDLLISTPGIKQASIEMPSKQQYENDFGKMAFTFLQDRVPQMIPHLVGFEIVDQEPDGARAVGMFGFRVGERFYYVPVFFINNQIKGMESIYDRQSDIMAPLTEDTVNDIVNRKTIEIGGMPDEKDPSKDITSPDFSMLTHPPNQGTGNYKYASAMDDMCQVWNTLQEKMASLLRDDENFQKMLGNAIISQQGGEVEKSASSDLKVYLKYAGGPEAVKSLFEKMGEDINFARAVATFYDTDELALKEFDATLAPKKAQAESITVITPETEYKDLGEAEGTKLLSQGFVIKDDRDEDSKSLVYSYEPESEVTNPDRTGLYNVALTGGRVEKCIVMMPSVGDNSPHMAIVRMADGRKTFTASTDRVFILGSHEDPEDLSKAIESQSIPFSEAKDYTKYSLVNKDGKCSTPFTICHGSSRDRENVTFNIRWCDRLDYTGSNAHRLDNTWVERQSIPDSSYNREDIELVVRPGKGLVRELDSCYIVPSEDWKLLPLSDKSDYEIYDVSEDRPSKPEEKFAPASYTEVTENLIKDAMHELRVDAYDEGGSFLIQLNGMKDSRDPVNYKTASISLVKNYGLGVEDAEIILKEASTKWKSHRMVKLAQMVTPPPMMAPPAPYPGDAGIPVQENWENVTEGSTNGGPVMAGPRDIGEAEMQQQMAGSDPMALAQEAAAMGQQQVFDHAGIAGLAGTNDASSVIDTYIPTWVESLDKLGRLLFLFYWKNEEFAERYGTDDMADLEDRIRNVYHKFGELIYELKNKTIGSQMGEFL